MFDTRPGDLRHVVSLEQRSSAVDAYGQQSTVWTSVATIRARIQPVDAKEQLQANQYQAQVNHKITVRYRTIFDDPQLAAMYRLVFRGRKFNITGSMTLDERRVYTTFLCTEGRSDG